MDRIPKKLLKGDKVDISLFKNPLKNGQGVRDPDNYVIQKDNAGHGGRKWKLKDHKDNRIASLGADGEILAD